MKKIISLFLALCMCLSVSVILTACGHEHKYQTEWSKDATNHWHACEGESCFEVSDKGEHVWDNGTVTTEATAGNDGEKTYTCTVCHAVKGESFAFSGIDEEKWNAMIAPVALTNYTVKYGGRLTQTNSDGTATVSDQSFTVKFNENKCQAYGTVKPEGGKEFVIVDAVFDDEGYLSVKATYESLFLAILADYKNYKYNSTENIYEIPNPIEVTVNYGGAFAIISVSNSRVSISADGKLLTLVCEYSQSEEGAYVATSEMTYTFMDYGTTVIP